MKRRLLFSFGLVVLVLSVLVVAWQGSFNLQRFNPSNPQQKLIFWPTLILIFVLEENIGPVRCAVSKHDGATFAEFDLAKLPEPLKVCL